MITTILLFNSWTAILLWGNHCNVFMMEYFLEVIDDIKNLLQDLGKTLGKQTHSGNFFCFPNITL